MLPPIPPCSISELCDACESGDLEQVKDILQVPPPAGWDLANVPVRTEEKTALLM